MASVALENISSQACSIGSRYAVVFRDEAGARLARSSALDPGSARRELEAGEALTGIVEWSGWCGGRAPARLALALSADSRDAELIEAALPARLDPPTCADGGPTIAPFVALRQHVRNYDVLGPRAFESFHDVALQDDGQTVVLTFIGGHPSCSGDDHAASVLATADELEIGLFVRPAADERPLGSFGVAPSPVETVVCGDVGYGWTLEIALSAPFRGARVRDLSGAVRFVRRPEGLAELTALPAGWELRSEYDVDEHPTGEWVRVYSPIADLPDDRRQTLTLVQAFDMSAGPADPDSRGVLVNGTYATLYRSGGELSVAWRLGGDGLLLGAHEADFSEEELIRLAESAVLPR